MKKLINQLFNTYDAATTETLDYTIETPERILLAPLVSLLIATGIIQGIYYFHCTENIDTITAIVVALAGSFAVQATRYGFTGVAIKLSLKNDSTNAAKNYSYSAIFSVIQSAEFLALNAEVGLGWSFIIMSFFFVWASFFIEIRMINSIKADGVARKLSKVSEDFKDLAPKAKQIAVNEYLALLKNEGKKYSQRSIAAHFKVSVSTIRKYL